MSRTGTGDTGRFRLGIVGAGKVVERYYLPALDACPTWELVAAADVRQDRRNRLLATRSEVFVGGELTELCDSNLDAVFIATPPETHKRLAVEALENGLHVLLEKPMSLTRKGARDILEAARRHDRLLVVGFNRRFWAPYRKLRRQLAGLGPGQRPRIYSRMFFDIAAWNPVTNYLGDAAHGGGVLHDVVSHQLDLISWLHDRRAVRIQVQALAGTAALPKRIAYQVCFGDGRTADCVAGHGRPYHESARAVFSRDAGTTHQPSLRQERWKQMSWNVATHGDALRRWLLRRPSVALESFRDQFRSFACAIAGEGSLSIADGKAGLACAAAIDACQQALANPGVWTEIERESELGARS